MKKIIIIFVLVGLISPVFSWAENASEPIRAPGTIEEAKELGEEALEVSQKKLPGTLEKIWNEDIIPVWERMYNWYLQNIWPKIESWFKKEVEPRVEEEIEKRKPILEEEFQKEKEELKEEIPEVSKSLWERFRELIR